ncbi:beta-ketoacyl synthase N-terminal-like domain-containing protein, partial [Streptococcus suis]
LSTGIGVIFEIEEQVARMNEKGPKRIRTMALPKALPNMADGNIAMQVGPNGGCKCIITACASANDALGEAFREITFG